MSLTTRHVLFLDLQDDPEAIAAYREWHRPGGPPAAVTRSIRESGISAMEIWQAGDRMVMLMETGPDFDPAGKAERDADPEVAAWEILMDRYQKRLAFAASPDEKWVPAAKVFDLADQ